jgi:hypothetical protein
MKLGWKKGTHSRNTDPEGISEIFKIYSHNRFRVTGP